MIKDCVNIKKKIERTRFKSKRVNKRILVTTWSDSDSFGSESEDEEIANLCLMARESLGENDKSEETILEYLLIFSKEYLLKVCSNLLNLNKITFLKSKVLERKTKFLEKKNETF